LGRAPNWQTKNQTRPAAITRLFRHVAKVLARGDDEPEPQPRRKSGETGKGFDMAAKTILRRTAGVPSEAYAAATGFLFATLDWMNPFHHETENVAELDKDFDNASDTGFPTLHL
jgi:hypothetical protein